MRKLFNKNNCKLSYSCMPNMDKYLASHNTRVLKEKEEEVKGCNCYVKENCPLEEKCLTKGVVYEASVFTPGNNIPMKYVGSSSTTFKERWYNHRSSFAHIEKRHQTALSDYVWKKKEEGLNPEVTFNILTSAKAYTASSGRCSLCLQEKVHILLAEKTTSLNKKSEISNKCRHKWKWTLEGWKPGTAS